MLYHKDIGFRSWRIYTVRDSAPYKTENITIALKIFLFSWTHGSHGTSWIGEESDWYSISFTWSLHLIQTFVMHQKKQLWSACGEWATRTLLSANSNSLIKTRILFVLALGRHSSLLNVCRLHRLCHLTQHCFNLRLHLKHLRFLHLHWHFHSSSEKIRSKMQTFRATTLSQ